MRELQAILWLDWRLVRRDFAVLAALALLSPPFLGLLAPANGVAAMLAFAFMPCTATLLGSTLSAGDGALSFLSARATSWPRLVALRLLHRCLLATAVALIGLLSAVFLSPAGSLVREFVAGPVFHPLAVALVVTGLTAAGALASAHARNPLLPVFVGWALYLGLLMALLALFDWTGQQHAGHDAHRMERLLSWVPGALGVLLFAAAIRLLSRRRDARPLPLRRTVGWGAAGLFALTALLAVPPIWKAGRAVQRMEAAWARIGAPLASPDELWQRWLVDLEAAKARLREAGLLDDWARREGSSERLTRAMQSLPYYGLELDGLDEQSLGRITGILEPVAPLLDRVEELVLDPRTDDSARAGLADFASSAAPLLLARAVVSQERGDEEAARRDVLASWLLCEPRLPTARWPFIDVPGLQRFDNLLAALRAGLPADERLRAGLESQDLIDSTDFALGQQQRAFTSGRLWLLEPRRATHEARSLTALAERLDDAKATGPCGRLVLSKGLEGSPFERTAELRNGAVERELSVELTLRVLDRRAGRPIEPASRCPDARWRLDEHADGSWSIVLENGPVELRHDEPPPDTRAE